MLHVVEQSNSVADARLIVFEDGGRMREVDPPTRSATERSIVIQPYGSLFFASAPVFEAQLPAVDEGTNGSVVIVRLRGVDQLGLTTIEVFRRYSSRLAGANSLLKVVISSPHVLEQIELAGATRRTATLEGLRRQRVARGDVQARLRRRHVWVVQRLEVVDEEE